MSLCVVCSVVDFKKNDVEMMFKRYTSAPRNIKDRVQLISYLMSLSLDDFLLEASVKQIIFLSLSLCCRSNT